MPIVEVPILAILILALVHNVVMVHEKRERHVMMAISYLQMGVLTVL